MVVAAQFGTERDYNAYLAANALPDTVFQVLVGGAVGSAFIPVFKGYLMRGEAEEAWRVTSSVINLGILITAAASIVIAIFARPIMDLWVPGQDAEFRELAASLTRVLLVAPILFAVSTFCSSALNSYNRFAVAALAPLMYNLSIIVAALFLSDSLGIHALAVGAVIGALLHLLVQVPALARLGMRWRPVASPRHPGVVEIGRLFAPRVLGLAATQLSRVLSAVVFASFLATGSMAYLDYAWLLMMTPLALAMAVGTAVFPTLSEDSAPEKRRELERVFLLSLRMVLFLTIPASIGLMIFGEPVIRAFLERNQFGPESTRATAYALVFYAIGLAGHATVEIVDRVFYALHDTRTPVLVAVGAIAINVLLSLVLMQTPLTYGGLALANSLAALIEAAIVIRLLARRLPEFDLPALTRSCGRILAASLVMGVPLAWLAQRMDPITASYGSAVEFGFLFVGAAVGALVYFSTSRLFQSDELDALVRLVRNR
jgi:putative peptidoglycan lipid II flippase